MDLSLFHEVSCYFQAWHAWALMNYEAVLFYKEQAGTVPSSNNASSADLTAFGATRGLAVDSYPLTPKTESVSGQCTKPVLSPITTVTNMSPLHGYSEWGSHARSNTTQVYVFFKCCCCLWRAQEKLVFFLILSYFLSLLRMLPNFKNFVSPQFMALCAP